MAVSTVKLPEVVAEAAAAAVVEEGSVAAAIHLDFAYAPSTKTDEPCVIVARANIGDCGTR